MANNLRVLTLNVRGLHDHLKRRKIFEWILDQKVDIIFLQETFCTTDLEPYLKASWKGGIHHATTPSSHSKGVSILFAEKLDYKIIDEHSDPDGRKLMLNVEMLDSVFTFVSVYAPNKTKERCDFFKSLHKWVNRYSLNVHNIIMCGDMNCCLKDKDRTPQTHINDTSRKQMSSFMKCNNLDDLWSEMKGEINGYTYVDKFHGTKSRLDYILVSRQFSLIRKKIMVSSAMNRDHKAVIADFRLTNNSRGNGYWKLNNSLLENDQYSIGVSNVFEETNLEYGDLKSKRIIWEIFKIKLKEFSIGFAIGQNEKYKNTITQTQTKLDNITELIEKEGYNEDNILLKSKYELEINEHYEKKAKGYRIRARAKWIKEGEKGSQYFLSLEKKRQTSNVIKQIKSRDKLVYSDNEILDETASFYENLYTSKGVDLDKIDDYLNSINLSVNDGISFMLYRMINPSSFKPMDSGNLNVGSR